MCHDDIKTKIVVPQNHLVWPPFLKASCFLNTIASSSRNSVSLFARLLEGPTAQTRTLPPQWLSWLLFGASVRRQSPAHGIPVSAGQLIQRIPFIQPKSTEGEGCMQTRFPNPSSMSL